jgi:hypothetical protein
MKTQSNASSELTKEVVVDAVQLVSPFHIALKSSFSDEAGGPLIVFPPCVLSFLSPGSLAS